MKKSKHLPDPSSIKLPPTAHVPLARCRVQLLGRAAPADTPDGLLATQKPLNELYESYSPVQSVLIAYTSGFVLRTPADDANAEELWFPIQDLMECGAVRAIGSHLPMTFAPLSTAEAQSSRNPALFTFIFKRRDIAVSDCWAVECKSDRAATALLTACMLAHKNPAGWASAVDRPPSTITNKEMTRAPPSEEWDGAAAKEAALWSDKFPQDYYEKPPLQGFYYTPKPGLIQHYALSEMMPDFDEEDMFETMSEADARQQQIEEESTMSVREYRPYTAPGDAYYPYPMNGPSARGAPAIYPNPSDMYGFPIGTQATFIPESVIYRDDRNDACSSDSDAKCEKHEKHGKKSKKSKKAERKLDRITKYNHYADDMMIVPQEAVRYHRAPSGISEGPFESHLPEPADHYVMEDYDPAWHYNMKSYIRDQQHVNGYTDPVSYRPYESHIDEFPPADYNMEDPYNDDDDDGPYERRLPVAGGRAAESDPKMLNRNFIIRQSEDYRRRL